MVVFEKGGQTVEYSWTLRATRGLRISHIMKTILRMDGRVEVESWRKFCKFYMLQLL